MTPIKSVGNFSSSEIIALLSMGKVEMTPDELAARPKSGIGSSVKFKDGGFGTAAMTYIKQTNWERRTGRSMSQSSWSKETAWGKMLESRAFDLLGGSYKRLDMDGSLVHPRIDYWTGTPDGEKYKLLEREKVAEVKCPFTLNSFFTFADCKDITEVRDKHPDGEKYYWQCISNACILGIHKAELIIYCPFESEIEQIIKDAQFTPDIRTEKWVERCLSSELPYLIDGKGYSSFIVFGFDIPKADMQYLEDRIIEAGKLLIDRNFTLT